MDTRDLWEDHVSGLTNQCRLLNNRVEQLEERMEYFEKVVLTLLIALKQAGIIQQDQEGDHSFD